MVFVSKILTSAFHHLVIFGASSYRCLWLEVVPLVILLISPWRPGETGSLLSFSGQSTLCRQLSSCRDGAQISGVQTYLLAEVEGMKQDLYQKLLASVDHTLT